MSFFIPADNLPALKQYQYHSEDHSLLTKYVLKRFWIEFEKIFPLWMAPNMVTLLGLVFNIVALLLVFYYNPNFDEPSPTWTYFFYAFCIFMYQTFDACDGIHARKTGQSGPLGELFDHCCDAINATLSLLVFGNVCGFGKSWLLYVAQFATLANFYLSTWETFFTHTLYLSAFSGPVEGIIIIIIMFCVTGVVGQDEIWGLPLFTVDLSSYDLPIKSYTVTSLFAYMAFAAFLLGFNVVYSWKNVASKVKDAETRKEAAKGLVPFAAYYASIVALLYLHPQVVDTYATQMTLSIGSTMAFTVGRIITNHLTNQRFPLKNDTMAIPTIQIALIWILTHVYTFAYDDVVPLVIYVGFGVTLAIYGMFVFEIIYDITTYLDIWALSIKHPKVVKAE